MGGRIECEFSLIRYVPDPVNGEFANIGVVLRETGLNGSAAVRFTKDWSKVRCLDPSADLELLESLEAEIAERLGSASESTPEAKPLMDVLADTLSNSLQVTDLRGTLAESFTAELEQLLRMYVEPLRAPAQRRLNRGRTAILGRLRQEFERAGVWGLMRKRIAAREYTGPGDSLKLDCGYRNGRVRFFQAVSLESDTESAKGVAFSLSALRAGVQRREAAELELTAVVETISTVPDTELYRFGVSLMEEAGLRVLTVADLGRVAETARQELRV